MEIVIDCPLGSKCEYIGDDKKLHRCAWYVEMAGRAADGREYNEWKCAMAWQPILMVELSSTNRGTSAAVESLRNETVARQDAALNLVLNGVNKANHIKTIEQE